MSSRGFLKASGEFTGLRSDEAIKKIEDRLSEMGWGVIGYLIG